MGYIYRTSFPRPQTGALAVKKTVWRCPCTHHTIVWRCGIVRVAVGGILQLFAITDEDGNRSTARWAQGHSPIPPHPHTHTQSYNESCKHDGNRPLVWATCNGSPPTCSLSNKALAPAGGLHSQQQPPLSCVDKEVCGHTGRHRGRVC